MAENTGEQQPPRLHSRNAFLLWLFLLIVIWLGGWLIYWFAVVFTSEGLLQGARDPIERGGNLESAVWAGLVGFVCLLSAAAAAWRGRFRLSWIMAGFVTTYGTALALLGTAVSPAIWGGYRWAYSGAVAGETACWKQLPGSPDGRDLSADEVSVSGDVYALSALSPTELWAVGQTSRFEGGQSLTLHWDGEALRVIASPGKAPLRAVSAVTPTDVWAAGGRRETLIEHWNGTAWRVVPTPRLRNASFTAIDARTTTDVWAVGSVPNALDRGRAFPFIEHWNGKRWMIVLRGRAPARLNGIAVYAADDAWAVGQQDDEPLIERWDGRGWRRMVGAHTPVRGTLEGVASLSAENVWAVGITSAESALIQHWDGRRWRIVRGVNRGRRSFLYDVSAVSPTDIWAGGETRDLSSAPLLEHWNGVRWQEAPIPHVRGAKFDALAAISPTNVVGDLNVETGGDGVLSSVEDHPFVERSSCSS